MFKSHGCRRGICSRHWLKISCGEMMLLLFVAILLSATDKIWADEVCCLNLGCYNNTKPYDVLPLPQCPDQIGVTMTLVTRENPTTGVTISWNNIPDVYRRGAKTAFTVHPRSGTVDRPKHGDFSSTFLTAGDFNVIRVIWDFEIESVSQITSNTRTVGGAIALLVNEAIRLGYATKDTFLCAGREQGAHICGQAGRQAPLKRISGLDPTGQLLGGVDGSVLLNPSCAELVDVIHGVLPKDDLQGTLKTFGHVDFYPRGKEDQLCVQNVNDAVPPSALGFGLPVCASAWSGQLYIESIRKDCFFSHHSCTDPLNIPGSCTRSPVALQSMGYYADTYPGRGIFYVETRDKAPYCIE